MKKAIITPCQTCNGTGKVRIFDREASNVTFPRRKKIATVPCLECHGAGVLFTSREE